MDRIKTVTEEDDNFYDRILGVFDGIEERTILPKQFFEGSRASADPGELKIRFHMLKEAVREFRRTAFRNTDSARRKHAETWDWIITSDYQWPFSFVNICEVFDLDIEAVRATLLHWVSREKERRYQAQAASAREGAGPECCPSIPPEGWSYERPAPSEGRITEQAA